jgi:hypothetical protein
VRVWRDALEQRHQQRGEFFGVIRLLDIIELVFWLWLLHELLGFLGDDVRNGERRRFLRGDFDCGAGRVHQLRRRELLFGRRYL